MLFALILMLATFFTGIVVLLDRFFKFSIKTKASWVVKSTSIAKEFFPILFLVFIIRTFIIEPFKIPSGSMMPTLIAGDFIAVNKFSYGLRLPVFNKEIYKLGSPKRGDVFVFHYPKDPSIDYIKRVIGLPGDKIRYENKQLSVNGQILSHEFLGTYNYQLKDDMEIYAKKIREENIEHSYSILTHDVPAETVEFLVPDGHYFAMGDNRDNSSDSRVWGFVPDNLLVGKAFVIWLNFNDFDRMGNWIK